MTRDVLWISLDERVIEHLRLAHSADGFVADGLIVRHAGDASHRIHYRIEGDRTWHIREVVVSDLSAAERRLVLQSDGHGHWRDGSDRELPALAGCHDIDIQASPFTNTLAIRRLSLSPGDAKPIRAGFITVPELDVQPARQRYTRVAAESTREVYLYESLESDFRAELPVDRDGLLLEYPGYFRRAGRTASAP